MKGLLDAAITASGKYTKVTNAYVSSTRTYDVWLNDGTTDGYEWYLIVMTDTATTARLLLGGCLEYDDATKIAKKAIRGGGTAGFADANGYPLVSAGGAEMTFALGSFNNTGTQSVGLMGPTSAGPSSAAAGNIFRVMVTGQVAWVWWGTVSTVVSCHGVGTYTNIHSTNSDLKPLAMMAHNGSSGNGGGTVWMSPTATSSNARNVYTQVATGGIGSVDEVYTMVISKVGATPDMNYDPPIYVGSRLHMIREGPTYLGGGNSLATLGWSYGLAPTDFLMFARTAACAIGDTGTVNGKIYENVAPPTTAPGLFINTQA